MICSLIQKSVYLSSNAKVITNYKITDTQVLTNSLVRSQVTNCSVIWRPNLIKDITLIEQIQRRATKFILNDYSSDYFDRLKQLNLLPLMYNFELNELVFTLKSLKYPPPSFNITDYITYADGNTRSSSSGKMIHVRNNNNADRHFFSIESLDCGMPYPLLTYLYLLK